MYLHRLELRAVGPYPDLVSIDFASLAASGVFLLEGPTGSGKSTIIDAVVYALFGGLAGSDASADRLHSQHADPAVEPFVDLVFETSAGVYRVRRTPPYDRPKQRGSGTVRQQASAQLWRLADPADLVGEPLSHRAPEIGAEVARVVGLNRDQFLQTVVLPQGEFAKFLRAPGEDRRKLLQSLFGTAVYDRTADELAARRRAAVAEVEAADARVRDALGRFRQASGDDDADESTADDVVAALHRAVVEHEDARARAATAAQHAVAHLHDVTARLAAVDRRRDLLTRRSAVAAAAPAITEHRTALALADHAAVVVAVADGAASAEDRLTALVGERSTIRDRHDVTDPTPRATHDRLVAALADVRHLVELERTLGDRRAGIETAVEELERTQARLDTAARALAARPDERAAIVLAASRAAETAADADAAERAVATAQELARLLAARVAATDAAADAAAAVTDAAATASAALSTENDLRARRIAGLAGELGGALAPGDVCPVCGSVEHPAVARPQEDHPSADQIDGAAAARADAERALAAATAEHAVAGAELARLTEAVGAHDEASVAQQRRDAESRLDAARSAVAAIAEHERQLQDHDRATRSLEQDHNDLVTRSRVLADRIEGDRARVDDDERRVRAARQAVRAVAAVADAAGAGAEARSAVGADGDETLSGLVGRVDAVTVVLRAVADLDDRVAAAERDVADRKAEVDAAVQAQGFTDVGSARAAALSRGEADRLRGLVAAADREQAVVEAGLAEPAVVAAADDLVAVTAEEDRGHEGGGHGDCGHEVGGVQLDLGAARTARDTAAAALDDATRAAAAATERAAAADRCAADLARAVRGRDTTSAESRAVVRLADIATAAPTANPTGITLGTYVLMRRFEDVVAAANDRLRAMLAGRFALETSDERESGTRARRTGLALAVRDHLTDSTRDPRSLSGGETFTFSLCLALGLADVVQAEAGGVSLGTLFVDEGFGTLDPETLDDVIGQLSRLTAGGRQVGIVSHVEELKQRIPERIAVRRTPGGGSRVITTV
ncbi:AAA family ATPase [Curtobacterium sp. MCBD17_032]|uniref:AAA family ATPase n=1 Tax=Curtobacterium sp. MCBD17_032 TaxID=2175659 RepID=UPI000DA95FB7|nr:SMC family ATPase [Curtobacterium sp. MCBD17_032]PZE86344.1 SMC family ATPase [Curtobacterium sp. MCBD17_032]